jgi:hypothetical protein
MTLSSKPVKRRVVCADRLRLARPLAITWDLNRDRPVVGGDGLPAAAVAVIRGALGLGGAAR